MFVKDRQKNLLAGKLELKDLFKNGLGDLL